MTDSAVHATASETSERASRLPLVIIILAQIQMAFNVTALPVSIGGIVEEYDVPATAVGTALVVYSLVVAAFVMLGSLIGKRVGTRLLFQVTALIHGASMLLMAMSGSPEMMVVAQAIAGLAAAGLVPCLVVLIAANYSGPSQAEALGWLAGTPAIASVLAFLITGFLATALTWRLAFALLAGVAILVMLLSLKLPRVAPRHELRIDLVGAGLAAVSVILISIGINLMLSWGALTATPEAPVALLRLSPAPFLVVLGLVAGQSFFAWSLRQGRTGRPALLDLEILDSREERHATFALLIVGALGPAVNFLIPLYIQIVQGRTSLQMAVVTIPYTIAIFSAAVLVVRLYPQLSPRQIGCAGFVSAATGLAILAFGVGNEWGTARVVTGLIILGLGEGALLTLLFNVLVSSSPPALAGDVGALRGTANNLSTALGTALASLISIGLLSAFVAGQVSEDPAFPPSLVAQVPLDQVDFISNDQLEEFMEGTTATSEQVRQAVQVNINARLRALKGTFLILAAVALLAVVPSLRLPSYREGAEDSRVRSPVPADVEVPRGLPRSAQAPTAAVNGMPRPNMPPNGSASSETR